MTFTNKKSNPDNFNPSIHSLGVDPEKVEEEVVACRHKGNANLITWVKLEGQAAALFQERSGQVAEAQAHLNEINKQLKDLNRKRNAVLSQIENLMNPRCRKPKKTKPRSARVATTSKT